MLVNVDENRRETVEAIQGWGAQAPEIVVTHPIDADDNLALSIGWPQRSTRSQASPSARWPCAMSSSTSSQRTRPAGRPGRRVLYLIWHDPWMTVARDTYLSRMLARIAWHTLPDADGGAAGAARYPALSGAEPWLGDVELVLLSSEPFAFQAAARRCGAGALPASARAARRRRAAQLVWRARLRRLALSARAGRRQCRARPGLMHSRTADPDCPWTS